MQRINQGFHCKMCKDAGKSESVYTGHRVKDSTGTVICPTLLGYKCTQCGKKGHTIKYCTNPKAQSVPQIAPETQSIRETEVKITNTAPTYASILSTPREQPTTPPKTNAATMPRLQYFESKSQTRALQQAQFVQTPVPTPPFASIMKYKGMSWADMEDSDDEFERIQPEYQSDDGDYDM